MSLSLPPPPRKLATPTSPRYPKINPNSIAIDHGHNPANSNASTSSDHVEQDVDEALAQLLAQSHINIHPDYLQQPHLPHCKHYARPLSITSLSSLGSESLMSHGFAGNGSHSRRISQGYFSPLSPALSEPSASASASSPTTSYFTSAAAPFQTNRSGDRDALSSTTSEQDMSLMPSSYTTCSYCSSVRSNSISSSNLGTTYSDSHIKSEQYPLSAHHPSSPDSPTSPINGSSRLDLERLLGVKELQIRDNEYYYGSQRREHLLRLVPSVVRTRLSFHLDECWFVHFSPSGEYLASTGVDNTILIWCDLQVNEVNGTG
ncbi:hypothetical protein BGZ94_005256 [Podila epigama]|nr:hypothetical protein BGZ94_005256 [Podila epigama]